MKSAAAAALLAAVVVVLSAGPALASGSPSDEYVEHEPSVGGSIDFSDGGGEEEGPVEQDDPAAPATPAAPSVPPPVSPPPASQSPAAPEGSERGGGERGREGNRKQNSGKAPDRIRRAHRPVKDVRVSISRADGEKGLGTALASLIGTGPGGIGPLLPLLGLGTLAAVAIGLRRGRDDLPEARE